MLNSPNDENIIVPSEYEGEDVSDERELNKDEKTVKASSKVSQPKTILTLLKNLIYGVETEFKSEEIDSALKRISDKIFDKDPQNLFDMVKDILSSTLEKEEISDLGLNLSFDKETVSRIQRYINANEIIDNISYCSRALRVLTNSIVSADELTKKSLYVSSELQTSGQDKNLIELVKTVCTEIVEKHIWNIVYETLKNGDCFVEVVDYKSKDVPVTQSLLTENSTYGVEIDNETNTFDDKIQLEYIDETNNKKRLDVLLELTVSQSDILEDTLKAQELKKIITGDEKKESFADKLANEILKEENSFEIFENTETNQLTKNDNNVSNDFKTGEDDDKKIDLDIIEDKILVTDIKLIVHNPWQIIKIQSRRFKTCLGYLVLPDLGDSPVSFLMNYNKISSSSGNYSNYTISGLSSSVASNLTSGVDTLYKELIDRLSNHLKNNDIYIDKSEINILFKRLISETSNEEKTLKLRYVPESRMEHFLLPSQRFYPYGEGIFYKSTFLAKLLIALETAVTIRRISDSVDKRVIYVEHSGVSRDLRNRIEDLKEKFKRKKFSVDSLGTVGSVPSLITSFEDIYIPTIRGRRTIEFDTLSSNVNFREVVDELKFFRDSIVSNLDVPPSYLNLEENLSNRSALTFENSIFCESVISYQTLLTNNLRSLVSKILRLFDNVKLKSTIIVTFNAPKQLQLEREADRYDIVLRLINTLSDLGIDREWLAKRYIDLPWDDIKIFAEKKKLDEIRNNPEIQQTMMSPGMVTPSMASPITYPGTPISTSEVPIDLVGGSSGTIPPTGI